MSRQIDERVVEMRFDNKQFENGVKQTVNSLTKLKESLKLQDAAKGLEGIEKASNRITLKGISEGVEALQKRFSTMGIVGMRVIQNITDGLMNKVGQAVNFVSDSIVSGGIKRAMNIENAHFQLQALLKDETKVQAVMADAMEAVDGTAYAYDEAAKAASQFAASGIQAGEDMLGALKGITGVAAMTNSDFESISQIFTTVAGNGRLMGDQLLQLSSRGLNVASTLADYFKEVRGQSNMTEGAIREMVTKGKLDFKTFSDAMTWAFGDSAKRANETFNGALSNMKSALARIGAGFFSPFVEQNGEMVQLFNTLREKINDIKSTLVFDEQMDAIHGLADETTLLDDVYARMFPNASENIKTFVSGLYDAANVEDKFGVKVRKTSEYFEEMAESGNLTVDMLSDMNKWGLNATSNLRNYLNGVSSGTIKASKEMTENIRNMVGDTVVLNSTIDRFVEDGSISYDMFKSSLIHANREVVDSMDLFETTMKGMFAEVKSEGHASVKSFDEFAASGINAQKAVTDYMRSVSKGEIRATYAIRQEIDALREETTFSQASIRKLAEEGKISYDVFQAAMSEAYGDGQYASKKFTDAVLDNIAKVKDYIADFDVSTLMEAFYYGLETVINLGKGLLSVLSPIGEAFANIFFNGRSIIDLAAAMENFTAKLRLSEKGSANLRDTFEGLFSVVDLLLSVFFKLAGAIFGIDAPIEDAGEGILGLTGSIGRLLKQFTSLIRNSPRVERVITSFGKGVRSIINSVSGSITWIANFVTALLGLSDTEGSINRIGIIFRSIEKGIVSAIVNIRIWLSRLAKSLKDLLPEDIRIGFESFFKSLGEIDLKDPSSLFKGFSDAFSNLRKSLFGEKELDESGKGFKNFFKNIKDALTTGEGTTKKLDAIKNKLNSFTTWIKTKFAPIFGDASLGGIISAAGGLGIFYVILRISEAIAKLTASINSIPRSIAGTLDALRDTLVAYQNDIRANTLLKIAGAFGILAVSLTVLSLLPTDKLLKSAAIFASVAAVLMYGLYKLKEVMNAGKKLLSDNPIDNLINSLSSSMETLIKKLGKAAVMRSIGKMVLSFAESLLLITGSVIALGLMYQKNPAAMKSAMEAMLQIALVVEIMTVLNGIVAGLGSALLGNKLSKTMDAMAKTIISIGVSLFMAVFAMNMLFKMDLPYDYPDKIAMLIGLMGAMGALGYALNKSAKVIPNKSKVASLLNPLVSIAILLVVAVQSLKTLFKMDLPEDYGARLLMFGGIITGIGYLAYKLNEQSKYIPKGAKQSSIYDGMKGMVVMLIGTVAAIKILFAGKLPSDWKQRLLVLEGIFVGMGVLALFVGQAGKLAGGKAIKAGGSILAMCALLFSIVGAIKLISTMSLLGIIKGASTLGVMFVLLGGVLKAIGTITEPGTYKSVLALSAIIGALTISLGVLSMIKAEDLRKSVLTIGSVLVTLAGVFSVMGKMGDVGGNWKSILAMCGVVVAVSIMLYPLSKQPWEQLLAAAVSLGGVMLALTGALTIVSKTGVDMGSVWAFVASTIALIPAALAIGMLATSAPINSLIPAALALAGICVALSGALFIVGAANVNLAGVLGFVAASLALIPMAYALQQISGIGWEGLAQGLIGLAGAMVLVGIGGSALGLVAPQIVLGSLALAAFALGITALGFGLEIFAQKLVDTIEAIGKLPAAMQSVVQNFIDFGRWLMEGFARGIMAGFGFVADTVRQTFSKIGEIIKGIFKINSPSKVTEEDGIFVDEGFASGITKGRNQIDNAVQNIFGGVVDKIKGFVGWGSAKEVGSEYTTNVASGVEENGSNKISNALSTALQNGGLIANDVAAQIGRSLGEQTSTGVAEGTGGINDILTQAVTSFAGEGGVDMNSIGNMLGMNLEGGLMGSTSVIPQELQRMLDQTGTSLDMSSFYGAGTTGGTEMSTGFSEALNVLPPELQGMLDESAYSMDVSPYEQTGYQGSTVMMDGFAEGFTGSVSNVAQTSAAGLQNSLISAMRANEPLFVNEGQMNALKYLEGIRYHYPKATITGKELVMAVIKGIESVISKYYEIGKRSAQQYIEGIRSEFTRATSIGRDLALAVLKGLESKNSAYKEAGGNAGAGFVEGLSGKIKDAEEAGKKLGEAAAKAAKKALDEHSPSRVMGKIGDYAGMGFVGHLLQYVPEAYRAGSDIGSATTEGLKYGINMYSAMLSDLSDPVIKPTLDLSELRDSVKDVQTLFSNALGSVSMNVGSISGMMDARMNGYSTGNDAQNGRVMEQNFYFNQTNNSPKPLSRIDIYRNTQNQFSRFKEAVKES